MLRPLLLALALGLIAVAIPNDAQSKTSSCNEWCSQNRCPAGGIGHGGCMNKCVAGCQKKHPNG
jgi:hypothetical protein